MTTLKDWNKYASDEDEQPVKKEKIKKTSIKIKNTHVVDPEWKEDRDGQRASRKEFKDKMLSREIGGFRAPKTPPPLARSRKIF